MTDIAERLARAVLDRIESDRLLNRDNVADAIRKELAVMKGPFWVPPLSPADYAPGAVPKPITASEAAQWAKDVEALAKRQPRDPLDAKREFLRQIASTHKAPPDTEPTRFTAIGGPYSGSHRTYPELAAKFLGGRYEIDIHLKHAQWIAKETPLPAPPKPKCPIGTTIEMKIGYPIPKGWREGAGSLSHKATPAPGNMFITKVE